MCRAQYGGNAWRTGNYWCAIGRGDGYSKAMFKYKLNKHAEQMNSLINAVARNVHNFNNLNGGTYLTETFIKMGEIPTEMIKTNNTNLIYDIFGQPWQIFLDGSGKFMFYHLIHNTEHQHSPLNLPAT